MPAVIQQTLTINIYSRFLIIPYDIISIIYAFITEIKFYGIMKAFRKLVNWINKKFS